MGSAVSVQAVASHCRGKREKRREEGGQISILRREHCTNMHVLPRLNLKISYYMNVPSIERITSLVRLSFPKRWLSNCTQ